MTGECYEKYFIEKFVANHPPAPVIMGSESYHSQKKENHGGKKIYEIGLQHMMFFLKVMCLRKI
jgi:hypothetical protein